MFKQFDGDGPDTEKMKLPRKPPVPIALGVAFIMFATIWLCDLLNVF
jgi:hypothetical protein